ncbi:MAG: DNA-directed RNA polymerase subunit alpha, partial [Geminicoccales bacterium]
MIQKNWQELIKPPKLEVQPGMRPDREATIIAEPLERGFGVTLGNALRRILLSSLQGSALTAVQIDSVLHEFSTVPGVREDVTDIVLNLKALAIRLHSETQKRIYLKAKGPCTVTASMIEVGHDVEIMDPDHIICHLDEEAELSMEMTVKVGRGYVPAALNKSEDAPIGLIAVDAIYSPVRKVAYKVDHARVGQVTDYDKLTMQIETNGSVSPEDAVALAARI